MDGTDDVEGAKLFPRGEAMKNVVVRDLVIRAVCAAEAHDGVRIDRFQDDEFVGAPCATGLGALAPECAVGVGEKGWLERRA